jgi:hypothetical protein
VDNVRQIKIHGMIQPLAVTITCRREKCSGTLSFTATELKVVPNSVFWICTICDEKNIDELVILP